VSGHTGGTNQRYPPVNHGQFRQANNQVDSGFRRRAAGPEIDRFALLQDPGCWVDRTVEQGDMCGLSGAGGVVVTISYRCPVSLGRYPLQVVGPRSKV
jgi:hypothetical protein